MKISQETYSSYSDEELMLRIIEDDESAFHVLYARYSKQVQRYFYRMLYQNIEIANDATQELFIKVYEKAKLFDSKKNFSTWLFSVASNQCKNYYRSKSRKPEEVELEGSVEILSTSAEDPIFDLSRFNIALEKALLELPVEQKDLFILRYQEAFSITEIAEITNKATGTIKSGLHRTIKKLAKALAPFHPKNLES